MYRLENIIRERAMLDYRMDTFLVLCDQMNYRKTAEILHLSQPAVTQHIQFIERLYDTKLFSYENHKLKKTEEGMILEKYIRAAKLQDHILREQLEDQNITHLRVGATKTIGDYFLEDHICKFLDNKDHALTLIVDNTEHLLKSLEVNDLDFAVIEGFFDRNHFDSLLLRQEPFVGICPRGHAFAGREITMEELFQETIIHREEGSGTRAILEQELSGYNQSLEKFQRHICISSFKLILDLVKRGYGISFVYNILADSDPELEKFTIKGQNIVRGFNVVYLKYSDLREKIDLFFGRLMHLQ